MFDLHGRVALITGGSRGIGRQAALALARQGADIVIVARRKDPLEETAKEIRALGVKCLPLQGDVTAKDDVYRVKEAVLAEFGTIDILINNAGGGSWGPAENMKDEDFMHNINTELVAPFRWTREFGKVMLEKGYGRVINVISILGLVANVDSPVVGYESSKGGMVNQTRAFAVEWATRGVTVNGVCPGYFPTDALNPEVEALFHDYIIRCTPMKRLGTEGELDALFVYLASNEASYTTGSICTCDGGWTAI